MTHQILIDQRFCGPPQSGNGGYVCGLRAEFIDGDAEITLHRPPPLDTPLDVVRRSGHQVSLYDASETVADGRRTKVDLQVPFSPTYDQALHAAKAYSGFREHFYPSCFVCGPDRKPGDGLRIFAGPLIGQSSGHLDRSKNIHLRKPRPVDCCMNHSARWEQQSGPNSIDGFNSEISPVDLRRKY